MKAVRVGLLAWPLAAAATAAGGAWLHARGLSPTAAYLATVTAAQVVLRAMEHMRPLRPEWRGRDPGRAHDLAHYALGMGLGQLTAGAVTDALATPLRAALVRLWGATPWPAAWPFAAQLALGVLVAELGLYWQHRAMHASRWLWRLHAVHHESARLDVLKATRQHPVDLALATVASLVPLVALGAPGAVAFGVAMLSASLGLLQHANLALATPPWLDRWVCTPAAHRLHHGRDRRDGERNFGVILMVYDALFGTWSAPRGACPPEVGAPGPGRTLWAETFGRMR